MNTALQFFVIPDDSKTPSFITDFEERQGISILLIDF
jgi:hypothetical protein